jgi:nucleotide-binding universal stress UspA family protein
MTSACRAACTAPRAVLPSAASGCPVRTVSPLRKAPRASLDDRSAAIRVNPHNEAHAESASYVPAGLLRLWEQEACERLHDAFDEAFGGMPNGVAVIQRVVRAHPGPALVELAGQRDDLLVVGYGGRSRLGYAVHGSVTRYCLAHARCPVLAVPPPELIRAVRARRHQWRPEDFAVPLAG